MKKISKILTLPPPSHLRFFIRKLVSGKITKIFVHSPHVSCFVYFIYISGYSALRAFGTKALSSLDIVIFF